MTRHRHHARLASLATTGIGALIALAVPLASPASAQDTTGTVLGDPTATECVTDIGTVEAPEAADVYTIIGDESVARYRAQEELASVGANEAVGETSAFVGQILLDADGATLPCSRFDVDLRTLTSDESRRDNFLYNNTLETGQFPLATFILTGVEGLEGPLPDGEKMALTLVGNLTIHGVEKSVAWDAIVTRDGDALTGTASLQFAMADFNIEEPVVGPVLSGGVGRSAHTRFQGPTPCRAGHGSASDRPVTGSSHPQVSPAEHPCTTNQSPRKERPSCA